MWESASEASEASEHRAGAWWSVGRQPRGNRPDWQLTRPSLRALHLKPQAQGRDRDTSTHNKQQPHHAQSAMHQPTAHTSNTKLTAAVHAMAYSSTAAVSDCALDRSDPDVNIPVGVQTGGRTSPRSAQHTLHPSAHSNARHAQSLRAASTLSQTVHACILRSSALHQQLQLPAACPCQPDRGLCCSLSQEPMLPVAVRTVRRTQR